MTDKHEVTSIKIDLTVLLKIIKHAKEANFKLATGQLHGVFNEKTIEISNCYPVPNKDDDSEDNFDSNMMSMLEEVNMDNNKVGWYQISYANDHLSWESVAISSEYQANIPYAVYLVYDILEVERGFKNPFKVFRLNPKFQEIMRRDRKITFNQMKSLNFKLDKIFQEIPVEIIRSPLTLAYLYEQKKALKEQVSSTKGNLDLIAYFGRTISFLVDSLEEQTSSDLKIQHDYVKPLKHETKENRIRKFEIPKEDFIENFVSKQRINNFLSKINNCGKFQLETSFLLTDSKKNE